LNGNAKMMRKSKWAHLTQEPIARFGGLPDPIEDAAN